MVEIAQDEKCPVCGTNLTVKRKMTIISKWVLDSLTDDIPRRL